VGSRERKKAATREALIDAAARLFAKRGVEGTTMDDIARAAGTSRTSVFNYFGYKEMIVCEIGARYVAEIAGKAQQAQGRQRSPKKQLQDMVDTLADIAERDPVIISAVARELLHPDPERRRRAEATMRYGEIVDGTLDGLEDAGLLREPSRRDSYARLMVDMVAGVLIRAGGDFPMRSLRTELHRSVDVMLDGVLVPT
jgi:TetR/AcrR family transcriptional regulator, cholesterol catabolism regulator